MINTSSIEHGTNVFKMFDEDQIHEILYATFDVMRTVGFKILHKGARKMLAKAGAIVKSESVKVPEHIVQECLRLSPKGWTIFDRNGKRAMEVTGRKSYFGRGVEVVYEMAAAISGGLDSLRERPFVMAYPEPIAPMVYPDHVIDRLFAASDLRMPQIPGTAESFGTKYADQFIFIYSGQGYSRDTKK